MRLFLTTILALAVLLLAGCGGSTGLPVVPGGGDDGGGEPPIGPPAQDVRAALAAFHALPRLAPLASRTATVATTARDLKPYLHEHSTALDGFDGPTFRWGGWVPYWDEMMAATRGGATVVRTLHGVTLTLGLADTATPGRYAAGLTAHGTDIYTGVTFDHRLLVRAEAGGGPASFGAPGRDWPTIAVGADAVVTADATHRIALTDGEDTLVRAADAAILLRDAGGRLVLYDATYGDPASGEAIRLIDADQGRAWFSTYQYAIGTWSKPLLLSW